MNQFHLFRLKIRILKYSDKHIPNEAIKYYRQFKMFKVYIIDNTDGFFSAINFYNIT